ncbi:hypothetical protein BDP27DRAFT_1341601 [Rhodocollybia butyracea]|uniref:Uncharacterized protein n=1 Tax=Rhodocollybia butyracea TaxID=206335 RepID=A0A9P5PC24_9AGAR|nr:hypothetical protein BDP27DRAFT_1341601 [Rhodocollybia butyracea]
MSSSRLSCFFHWCRCLICSSSAIAVENSETDLYHVATLVKAFKAGTALDASYDPIWEAVMKTGRSRNALITAMMDNMKLSQFMAANLPKELEFTSDYIKAAAEASSVTEKHLVPPHGTRGFFNDHCYIAQGKWTADVYAYRHAKSDKVTVIILHSGSISTTTGFSLRTEPKALFKAHYPRKYDSRNGGDYNYHIEHAETFNMIGPDGKNAIVFKPSYKETFTGQFMEVRDDPTYLQFDEEKGQIHGMSVLNISAQAGTSINIAFHLVVNQGNRKEDAWNSMDVNV